MKKKLALGIAIAAAISALGSVVGAAGSPGTGTKAIDPHGVVVAVALNGTRVAYALGGKVSVWNVSTGQTTKVSGKKTEGAGNVIDLAIAGSQVAWYMNVFGNSESDDTLFDSSLLAPKETQVSFVVRMGDACGAAAGAGLWPPSCAGKGLGGVVASGKRILVSRWTAHDAGAVTAGGLYSLVGKRFTPVVTGPATVKSVAADSKRVAVLHADGTLGVYSASGKPVCTMTPAGQVERTALSGSNLVVLEPKGALVLYDAGSCSVRKTFTPPGDPSWLVKSALAVGNGVAVYSAPSHRTNQAVSESAVHAINLSTGTEKVVAQGRGEITALAIDSLGLAYAVDGNGFGPNRLVFVPLGRVAKAVS